MEPIWKKLLKFFTNACPLKLLRPVPMQRPSRQQHTEIAHQKSSAPEKTPPDFLQLWEGWKNTINLCWLSCVSFGVFSVWRKTYVLGVGIDGNTIEGFGGVRYVCKILSKIRQNSLMQSLKEMALACIGTSVTCLSVLQSSSSALSSISQWRYINRIYNHHCWRYLIIKSSQYPTKTSKKKSCPKPAHSSLWA